MEYKKELKLIRYTIVTLLAGTFFLIIIEIPFQTLGNQNELSSKSGIEVESGFGKITLFENNFQPQNSEIGLTYTNSQLGFSITKPNHQWDFNTDIDDLVVKNNGKLLANGFLDGLYVETNGDKGIFVGVFDISHVNDFTLGDYINAQIDSMESSFDSDLRVKNISENEWAIFGMKLNLEDASSYGEELMHIHDDKLFMVQYVGLPPEQLDHNKKEEVRSIFDSFTLEIRS